jgi:RNA polymerase sigma-70 factor (ECF subfamily)
VEAVAETRGISMKFEDFYRAEFPQVFRTVCLALGDEEAARDLTQEAFKRAFARWRRLANESWAGGWVTTTALNLSRKHRSSPRHSPIAADGGRTRDTDLGARVDVARALQQLPLRQRQVVVLFYIRDFSVPVIAQVMSISEGTVKAHLAQGRTALRTLLEVRHG